MIRDGIMACEDAWAGGLFDGEGTVGVTLRGKRKLPRIFFALNMTDLDVVNRFADWIATKIEPRPEPKSRRVPHQPHYKTQYYIQLTDWQKIEIVYQAMKPWLGQRRREQFESAITQMSGKSRDPRHLNPDGSCTNCGTSGRSPSGSCTHCATERNRRYKLCQEKGN